MLKLLLGGDLTRSGRFKIRKDFLGEAAPKVRSHKQAGAVQKSRWRGTEEGQSCSLSKDISPTSFPTLPPIFPYTHSQHFCGLVEMCPLGVSTSWEVPARHLSFPREIWGSPSFLHPEGLFLPRQQQLLLVWTLCTCIKVIGEVGLKLSWFLF